MVRVCTEEGRYVNGVSAAFRSSRRSVRGTTVVDEGSALIVPRRRRVTNDRSPSALRQPRGELAAALWQPCGQPS